MTRAETRYTAEEVYHMILQYKSNLKAANRLKKDYIKSFGVGGSISQYGEESGMPRGQGGTGDPTAKEVERMISRDAMINRLESKVRYVQHRWHRIEEEEQAIVFQLTLDGRSMRYISDLTGHSKDKVRRLLIKTAEVIRDKE